MSNAVKYLSQIATIFQVLGNQYFSVETLTKDNLRSHPTLGYKISFFIVFVFLTGLTSIFVWLFISENPEAKLEAKNFVTLAIMHSMLIGLILIICVSLVQSFFATRLTKKIFLNAFKIDELCRRDFGYQIDHRAFRNKLFKHYSAIVSFVLISSTILNLYESFFIRPNSFLHIIIGTLPILFLLTPAVKFGFNVELVNLHLETVHKLLQKSLVKPQRFKAIVCVFGRAPQSKAVKEIYAYSVEGKLRTIKNIYNVTAKNAEIVNKSLGLTILTITSVMVIVLTTAGYNIFLSVLGKAPIEKLPSKNEKCENLHDCLSFPFRYNLFICARLHCFVSHRLCLQYNPKSRKFII